MKIYFDFGLLTFIHFAMWCDEHEELATELITFETAEKLQFIADVYLKETEAREKNSYLLDMHRQDIINNELREEVKLKKL